jgi:hypothetical protein
MHRLGAECFCRAPRQGNVIADLSAGKRHASTQIPAVIPTMRMFDGALLDLEVQVRIGKSILTPW